MLNEDLYRLIRGFQLVKDLPGVRFAVAVARNNRMVAARAEDLDKGKAPSDAYEEYAKAEMELLREHAKKDEKGNPISTQVANGQQGYQVEDLKVFETAHALLVTEHQEAVDEHKEKMKVFEELMKEECDLKLVCITEKDLPENFTPKMAANIIEMLPE